MDMPLDVEVRLPSEPIYLGRPCLIEVVVVNKGVDPVLVNKRLSIGYKDSLSRELYLAFHDPESGAPAPTMVVDYQRDFSEPSDYGYLTPGDSIARSFDLFEWYQPQEPGVYRLIVYYQADEPLASTPPQILKGVYSSKPADLRVLVNE